MGHTPAGIIRWGFSPKETMTSDECIAIPGTVPRHEGDLCAC